MEVKYDDKDLALILLGLLSFLYTTFRDIILYSLDTLTIDDDYDALLPKEKIKHLVVGTESQAEGLVVCTSKLIVTN